MGSLCDPGADRAFFYCSLGYAYSAGYFAWENLILSPEAASSGI